VVTSSFGSVTPPSATDGAATISAPSNRRVIIVGLVLAAGAVDPVTFDVAVAERVEVTDSDDAREAVADITCGKVVQQGSRQSASGEEHPPSECTPVSTTRAVERAMVDGVFEAEEDSRSR